jgi:hypothetical protein
MSSGKKQIALFAIAAGLFTALMIAGVAGNVVHGNYKAVPLVFSALALAVFAIWFGIWFNQRRTRLMFRDPAPDRLIAHYHATVRRIQNADAAAAYLSALAAAVYGQFDRAREELDAVDWEKAPAMYRGHRLHVLALIALLEKRDKADALRLAARAAALEGAGAEAETGSAAGMPILHDAILVAAGEGGAGAISRTQRAAGRIAGVMPALCAWALSLHFERSGQSAEAARYRNRALEAVPHFVGLNGS